MIDTDKYEGHAEGPWTIEQNETGDECAINAQDYGTIAQTFYRDSDKLFMATTRLIADAPLLLAEVKRLREEILEFADYLEEKVIPYMTNDMYEVVPIGGMISDLHKMIKGDD